MSFYDMPQHTHLSDHGARELVQELSGRSLIGPELTEALREYDILPYAAVEYNPTTHRLGIVERVGDEAVQRLVALAPEQLAAELDRKREQTVLTICQQAKELIETEVNPLGGFEFVQLAQAGKQKAADTVQWVRDNYLAVEVRKAEISAGLWDADLSAAADLTWIGKKPWTVAQILSE